MIDWSSLLSSLKTQETLNYFCYEDLSKELDFSPKIPLRVYCSSLILLCVKVYIDNINKDKFKYASITKSLISIMQKEIEKSWPPEALASTIS